MPGDAEPLRAALNEAFADDAFFHEATPGSFAAFYLGSAHFDPSLWLLARDGDEVAGFALAFPQAAGDPTLGWIESFGVRRRWRRRGLGSALLHLTFRALLERGLRRVGLGVDAKNETGAVDLYRRAGMRTVRRRDNWVLDVSKQTA